MDGWVMQLPSSLYLSVRKLFVFHRQTIFVKNKNNQKLMFLICVFILIEIVIVLKEFLVTACFTFKQY